MKKRFAGFVRFAGFAGVLAVAASCVTTVEKTPESGSTMPASIIDPYLQIQESLADDRVDNVKAAAGNIATASTALGAPAMKIQTAAVQVAAAADASPPDLETLRQKFGLLSEALDSYMTGLKIKAPEGVRTAYCPMARKPWLQKGNTLANPYYGKEMPTCGDFR